MSVTAQLHQINFYFGKQINHVQSAPGITRVDSARVLPIVIRLQELEILFG